MTGRGHYWELFQKPCHTPNEKPCHTPSEKTNLNQNLYLQGMNQIKNPMISREGNTM